MSILNEVLAENASRDEDLRAQQRRMLPREAHPRQYRQWRRWWSFVSLSSGWNGLHFPPRPEPKQGVLLYETAAVDFGTA